MADIHSPATRRYNMSQVRSKNTKTELLVRKWLQAAGFRFRLHRADLPGKPEVILPKYKTVIFMHGCF
jgi:DNA mismatch endonuclease, patch repair protein